MQLHACCFVIINMKALPFGGAQSIVYASGFIRNDSHQHRHVHVSFCSSAWTFEMSRPGRYALFLQQIILGNKHRHRPQHRCVWHW